MFKSGFVTIIGKPNVGKSTLINAIVGEKVSIVSPKANTTRDKILGVYNSPNLQIVFTDTPGLLKPKNKLDEYMSSSIKSSIDNVDVILYVLDGSKPFNDAELNSIQSYTKLNTPVIVVVNKIDATKPEKIYPELAKLNNISNLSLVMPLSALKKQNIQLLIDEISKYLTDNVKYFSDEMFTDKPLRFQVSELIREKTLWFLKEEVPTSLAVELTEFSEEDGLTTVEANIICEKESHKKIIVGKSGDMIKKISTQSRQALEKMLQTKVFLQLYVKVKPNWKQENTILSSLGYDKKNI